MKRSRLTIFIAEVLILIFALMLFVFTVRQSEVAVVTMFGKLETTGVKTNAGPYLKWPWPVERVYTLDQRVHSFEDKNDEMTLADQNIIMLQSYVGWRISDPLAFFQKFKDGSVDEAQSTLANIVRSAKQEVAGTHALSDFVSASPTQMKFPAIEDQILQKVRQKVADGGMGIDIKFVQIKKIGFPESVTEKVFNQMKSERNAIVSRIMGEAQEQVKKITSDADAGAAKLIGEADAQAKQIRGEGEAEMVQSLQVFQQNPSLADFIMNLDMLQEVTKDKTTWVLDRTTPGLGMLSVKPGSGQTNAAPIK